MNLFKVLGVLLLLAAPLKAQAVHFDPDNKWTCWSCYSHNAHFMGGVAADIIVRPLPFLTKSWRKSPVGRVALAGIIGTAWELTDVAWCQAKGNVAHGNVVCDYDQGFGRVDLAYVVAGAITTEVLNFGLKRLFKAIF